MHKSSSSRLGSSLLLVVSMIVLMVTVATAFMTTMSRQRGTAVLLAARTRCEIGMEQATAAIIRQLLEEYTDSTKAYSWTKKTGGSEWHRRCVPVNNPDGDPWTDDGVPAGSGFNDAGNLVNVGGDVDLADMMQRSTGDDRTNYYGIFSQYRGTRARWHNMRFYDDFMQPIEIDASLSEAEKADIRRNARYVLRYAVVNMDCEGQITANNNYPDAPIYFDGSNNDEFNRYQSYLRHFGRNIKSMTAAHGGRGDADMQQYRSQKGDFSQVRDPFDYENLCVFPDGIQMDWGGDNSAFGLMNDLRLRRESTFRMDARNWVEKSSGITTKSPHMPGHVRLTTWYQIGRKMGGTGMGGAYYTPHFVFTPYGGSMLGEPLDTVDPDPCTVPWRVNLLTCASEISNGMIRGLSAHNKFGSGTRYDKDPATTTKWYEKASQATANLFGPGYPEAFPLGFEDGKDVPLVGMVHKNRIPGYVINGTGDHTTYEKPYRHEEPYYFGGDLQDRYPAAAFSYWADVVHALGLVRSRIHWAWRGGGDISTWGGHPHNIGDYQYLMKNPISGSNIQTSNGDSYIDKDETDPDVMMNQVIMEVCRVIGEGYIAPHSGAVPATSWNKYNHALPSLLGGGESFVGLNIKKGGGSAHWMKRCQLSPQTNTRAMEYTLNDVLISLFGKANPHYQHGVDQLKHIAVDFNGDGYAESTATGWHNTATDQHTWSWWWNGLGPDGEPLSGNWMKQGCWIRFHEDQSIERKRGGQWIALTVAEKNEFLTVNDVFLYDRWTLDRGPIRQFSHTGRFFIGKSSMFQSFVRAEILNIPKRRVMAAVNRSFIYHIDPNKDGSFEDSHVATHQEFDMKSTDL